MAWDKNQYDDRSEVASYIWHNYPALFSEQDRLADRKVHTDAKAAATDSEPLRNAILAKWGVNGDPTMPFWLNGASMVTLPYIVTVTFQEANGVTTVTTSIKFASKADRDAAFSTGMTDGMEMSYKLLDDVLAEG